MGGYDEPFVRSCLLLVKGSKHTHSKTWLRARTYTQYSSKGDVGISRNSNVSNY